MSHSFAWAGAAVAEEVVVVVVVESDLNRKPNDNRFD